MGQAGGAGKIDDEAWAKHALTAGITDMLRLATGSDTRRVLLKSTCVLQVESNQ
jgi:hypothetical protein